MLGFTLLLFATGAAAPPVTVDVQVLEASNDPAAAAQPQSRAARDLESTLNFKSFRTLSQQARVLRLGEFTTYTLPNGATLTLSPTSTDDKERSVRLQVEVHQGVHTLNTEYTVRSGGTVFVSAGKSGKEAVLVLAIIPTLN